MDLILQIIAWIALLIGLASSLFIIWEAFHDEIWKGLLSIVCGLYLLYFAIFDWEHEWKWPIIIMAIGGSSISAGILGLVG